MSKGESSKTTSFVESVDEAEKLVKSVYAKESESLEILAEFINSAARARAFFVAFLTRDCFDLEASQKNGIIKLIGSKLEFTREVLIKNMAMSAAMVLHHQKNESDDLADQSELVHQRTIETITLVGKENFNAPAQELLTAIEMKHSKQSSEDDNSFSVFIERWQYDTTQLEAIKSSLTNLFN